jgi:hypothetical protein
MIFKINNFKHALSSFVIWAFSYQIFWYIAFQFIFQYSYVIEHAQNFIFGKLLGEILLYMVFSIRFTLLVNEVSNKAKYYLCSLSLLLFASGCYAIVMHL